MKVYVVSIPIPFSDEGEYFVYKSKRQCKKEFPDKIPYEADITKDEYDDYISARRAEEEAEE